MSIRDLKTNLTNPKSFEWYCISATELKCIKLKQTCSVPSAHICLCCHSQSLKGVHNFRASGDYDSDCSAPLTPLCTQPEQVIKGKRPSVCARAGTWVVTSVLPVALNSGIVTVRVLG